MSSSCFNAGLYNSWGCPPNDPLATPFLFDLDQDEGEYGLYLAMPSVAREMLQRLDRYKETEVHCPTRPSGTMYSEIRGVSYRWSWWL